MSKELVSYIGVVVTDHGGTINAVGERNVYVDGILVPLDGDSHSCPRCGVTRMNGTGHAKFDGRNFVRITDTAGCGAAVVTGSKNTYTEGVSG